MFGRAEFQQHKSLLERFVDWLQHLFPSTGGGGGSFAAAGGLFFYLALFALLVLLVFLIVVVVRGVRGRTRRQKVDDVETTVDPEVARTVGEWRSEAERAEADGRWKDAMLCRYRELVGELVERGAVRAIPGLTTGELRGEVATSAPDELDAFSEATTLFELPWYARRVDGTRGEPPLPRPRRPASSAGSPHVTARRRRPTTRCRCREPEPRHRRPGRAAGRRRGPRRCVVGRGSSGRPYDLDDAGDSGYKGLRLVLEETGTAVDAPRHVRGRRRHRGSATRSCWSPTGAARRRLRPNACAATRRRAASSWGPGPSATSVPSRPTATRPRSRAARASTACAPSTGSRTSTASGSTT